ncbi:MAG: glycosyltransferase family 2 protein [Actinomycetota bacterium]
MVTPTFDRPAEVAGMLANLAAQTALPDELILVDGSPPGDLRTEGAVRDAEDLPFPVTYLRATGGAALQRNVGIDMASGEFVALIDDDVRLAPAFFERILAAFAQDSEGDTGCIAGCLLNPPRDQLRRFRWAIHKWLGTRRGQLAGTFDWGSGHIFSRICEDPGEELRRVDVVGSGCAVWRRAVFDQGYRFSPYFHTYSYNEDFHLALRAGHQWRIFDLGAARFEHLQARAGRPPAWDGMAHQVINSRFLFVDLVPARTTSQEARFWGRHGVDLVGRLFLAMARPTGDAWREASGHAAGMIRAYRRWPGRRATSSPSDRSDEI